MMAEEKDSIGTCEADGCEELVYEFTREVVTRGFDEEYNGGVVEYGERKLILCDTHQVHARTEKP